MIKIHLDKRAKIILFALVIIVFAVFGRWLENHKGNDFFVETVATEEENAFTSNAMHIIDGKVNINSADAEEIELIPGIGKSLAARIISYRENNGPFLCIEDIMAVSGISENKFNVMKDTICVEERTSEE